MGGAACVALLTRVGGGLDSGSRVGKFRSAMGPVVLVSRDFPRYGSHMISRAGSLVINKVDGIDSKY